MVEAVTKSHVFFLWFKIIDDFLERFKVRISFSNDVFTQSYDYRSEDEKHYAGNMEIKFNIDQTKGLSFTAESKLIKDNPYSRYLEEYKLSGHYIECSGNNKLYIQGEGNRNKISTIYYSKAYTKEYEEQIGQ